MTIRTPLVVALTAAIALTGCGPEEQAYTPKEVYSGKKPDIPQPPTLENKSKKDGDAYTIWGAVHDIHSYVSVGDVKDKEITITGYVVAINWANGCKDEMKPGDNEEMCVPKCAIFAGGEKDTPAGCEAPLPTFWIADTKDEKSLRTKAIPVIGWACNWSRVYDLIDATETDDEATVEDPICGGILLPSPIPNIGAKIKMKAKYGFAAEAGTKGPTANPRTGVLRYISLEYTEPSPEKAKLPFMD